MKARCVHYEYKLMKRLFATRKIEGAYEEKN